MTDISEYLIIGKFDPTTGHDHDGLDSKTVDYSDLASVPAVFPPNIHPIAGADHDVSNLADLNSKISDATLDDASDLRDPNPHPIDPSGGDHTGVLEEANIGFDEIAGHYHDGLASRAVDHDDLLNITASQHHIKTTSIAELTDHNKVNHDALAIAHTSLSSVLPDDHHNKLHPLGDALNHSEDTLANLNGRISDATLDDVSASRYPLTHAGSHEDGGADEVIIENLPTNVTNQNRYLRPDGAGGVQWISTYNSQASDDTESVTTLVFPQEKLSMPFTPDAGDYVVLVSVRLGGTANKAVQMQVQLDDTDLLIEHSQFLGKAYDDANDPAYVVVSGMAFVTLTAAPHTLDVDFGPFSGGDTAAIKDVRIRVWRVA